jgi:hypothetical protein
LAERHGIEVGQEQSPLSRPCAGQAEHQVAHLAWDWARRRRPVGPNGLGTHASPAKPLGNELRDGAFLAANTGDGQQFQDQGFGVFKKRSVHRVEKSFSRRACGLLI